MGTFKVVNGRDPAAMPWKDMEVEIIIESTGAFNSLEGGSKHIDAGAKKVVLTAPGKNCPTYVVGVNEGDYDAENDVVVSNASCTTNGMASVCKVLDESFGVEYGMMTTTHSYTGDQMILDGRHRDLRRARAGACNIVPTSTGAATVQGQAQRHRAACAHAQCLCRGLGGEGEQEDLRRGCQCGDQGSCRWALEGHHQFRTAAIGVQRLHADRLLELGGRSADHGHGRGLGEGRDVVRQRVGLLAAGQCPHCDRGGEAARGSL